MKNKMHFGWYGHPVSNISFKGKSYFITTFYMYIIIFMPTNQNSLDIYKDVLTVKDPKKVLHSVYLRMEDDSQIFFNISELEMRCKDYVMYTNLEKLDKNF